MYQRPSTHVLARSLSWRAAAAILCFALLAAGSTCWTVPITDPVPDPSAAGLKTFESPEAFKQYLAEQVNAQRTPDFELFPAFLFMFGGAMAPPAPVPQAVPDALPAMEAAPGDGGFSSTNVQESGVDESDVVKNDATYLYVLGGRELRIVRAVPADDMAVLSRVDLPGVPAALYLRGDMAIALSGADWDSPSATTVTLLDVTDRTAPALLATVDVGGSLVTSRLIGSKLHLVVQAQPRVSWEDDESTILAAEYDDLVPDLSVRYPDGRRDERNLVEWQAFYRPVEPDGYNMVVVVTVDVDDPNAPVRSAGVVADASTIYASPEALYLTNGEYDYVGGRSRQATEIHKFDLTGDGAALVGTGAIPGRLLNRYSLGEYQGYLRAATTVGHVSRSGNSSVTNNVYVLGPEDGGLNIVGRIEDIAPGEQIYAARFMGDRGFLVTFKKVDPLFTLDLADPASPRVVGELKVPGYSDYIHPLGDNHLLTIGKDAVDMDDFAWYQGVQLSVFDVTDFANPQQVDAEIVGDRGTESEALYDPHAFNYYAPAGMLAVPMTIAERAGREPSAYGEPTFQGLCLFTVSADEGIEPSGRISMDAPAGPTGWPGSSDPTRGIFMGDYVYAVTGSLIRAVPLANVSAEPVQLPLE